MHTLRLTLLALVAAALAAGCSDDPASAGGKPRIAVTIVPLASLTQELVGDAAEVVTLVPPGISPHGYEPTAKQIQALKTAPIVIYNGAGYDNWAGAAARQRGDDVVSLSFASLVGIEEADHHHDHHEHEGHDHAPGKVAPGKVAPGNAHAHGGVNPHLWVDPVLTAQFVHALGHELAEHIPNAADAIEQNTHRLLEQLKVLDQEYAAALSPHVGRPIITFHNAFDPMAERYGLKIGLTLMPDDAIGATLTPGRLEQAIALIREHNIKAIYSEPQLPADIAAPIVQTTGVKVLVLDPLGDPHASERDTYLKMMRHNLQKLVEGFGTQ